MVARRPPDAMTWPLKNVHLVAIGPLNMDVPYNPIVHIIVPMKMAADLTKHCGVNSHFQTQPNIQVL
jgi:hypothetical protein